MKKNFTLNAIDKWPPLFMSTCFTRFGMEQTKVWQFFCNFFIMIPNGNNGFYQLGEGSAIFRPKSIFNYSPNFSTGFKSGELRGTPEP